MDFSNQLHYQFTKKKKSDKNVQGIQGWIQNEEIKIILSFILSTLLL
jgi:hypothetical protein